MVNNLQQLRDRYLEELDKTGDDEKFIKEHSNDLFNLDLTVYTKDYSFESILYNSFSKSVLDKEISLHPDQYKSLRVIEENKGTIFSAPTSYGKTFVMFEYIARHKPKTIFLIVPTLALVDEYNRKIIKKYSDFFSSYKVHTNLSDLSGIDHDIKNIFILTHDRVIEHKDIEFFERLEIDLLVIDEVYKLQRDLNNDRVLTLNLAYYRLVNVAKKHILLAPFIGGVENSDNLPFKPTFHLSTYSPVINKVITYDIEKEDNSIRNTKSIQISNSLPADESQLIYFPTVTAIYNYSNLDINNGFKNTDRDIKKFITWIKREFHEDWYVVKSLEKGFLVHNGQLPIGIRIYLLNIFNTKNCYNKMLCTSTLLEGVNTTAKNIIITKPSRSGSDRFDAFDFFNLVGRSGRLYKHYLGKAHYIKAPDDPSYMKDDAIKNIEFEVTEESQDMNIQINNYQDDDEYKGFIKKLNISHEEYIENIGAKYRFETISQLHLNYLQYKDELIEELQQLSEEEQRSRSTLIKKLHKIIVGNENKLSCFLINQLINRRRLGIKTIVNSAMKFFDEINIDYLIAQTLKLKYSFIEHEFYSKVLIIIYLLEIDDTNKSLIEIIEDKIKHSIDILYFSESKTKRMLKDLGIYEKDINKISSIIGEECLDLFHLKKKLIENKSNFGIINFISKFIIGNL